MIRQIGLAVLTGMLVSGCAVPSHYLGIPTRGPMSAEERLAVQAAEAEGRLRTGECSWWNPQASERYSLPCGYIPNAVLASMAWSDDKHAMLELGKRLEEGRGIAKDLDKAETLYERAARDTTGGTAVASKNGYEPITWTSAAGLPEAEARLIALRAKRGSK